MQLIGIHRKTKEKIYIGVRLITIRTYVGSRREGWMEMEKEGSKRQYETREEYGGGFGRWL